MAIMKPHGAIAMVAALLVLAVCATASADCHGDCRDCDGECSQQSFHACTCAVVSGFVLAFDLDRYAFESRFGCRVPNPISDSVFKPPESTA